MARGLKDDLPDGESELFFRKGLYRAFAKLPDGQISYSPAVICPRPWKA
jgi:hypothetical protein